MEERVSAWEISEAMGKPRAAVRAAWQEWGLLRPPGPDGRWDPDELVRIAYARVLEDEARRLSRRALLLQRDGYRVDVAIRRRAMADVLGRMTRAGHKTAQVLWEIRALDRRYVAPPSGERVLLRLEVQPNRYASVLTVASDALVDHWYQPVDLQTRVLPGVGQAKGIPVRDSVPFEERLSLVMCSQLLHEDFVRNRLGLPRTPPHYGPPDLGHNRSNAAPLLRGQFPPPRKSRDN